MQAVVRYLTLSRLLYHLFNFTFLGEGEREADSDYLMPLQQQITCPPLRTVPFLHGNGLARLRLQEQGVPRQFQGHPRN